MMRLVLLAGLLLMAAPAAAQEMWDRQKGDCEQVFRGWRTNSVGKLRACVQKWEMYRDVTRVSDDDRAVAQEAFDKLYQEGNERDGIMALSALKRLGLRPSKLRSESKVVPRSDEAEEPERVVRPERAERAPPREEPPPEEAPPIEAKPRKLDPRAAKAHAARGKEFLRAGKLSEAVSELLISADADPTFADPLYLAATAFVQLDQPESAIQYLGRMRAINSDRSRALVRQAATDPNFARIRGIPAFKDVTGTASIQLLNGAGDPGMKKVIDFKQRLQAAGMPVASVSVDLNPRTATFIYTKPGFERQGEELRRQLQLGLVHKKPLHWPSDFDVILVYGEAKKDAWVDDEAEKSGAEAKAKKKAEEDAKKKEEEQRKKDEEEMRKKLKMLKMMESMEADPTGGAVPPPEGAPSTEPL